MTTRPRVLASLGALSLALASLAAPALVLAHVELETTAPAADATVDGTPTEISATFSGPIEPDSALSLRDAEGQELAGGGVDPGDATRLVIAPVPELATGTYEVRWTSVSDDGHVERDTWTFTVTAAPSPTPAPTASPTVAPSETETTPPTPSPVPSPTVVPSPSAVGGGSAGSGTDVVLPILIALALVGLVGGLLVTRRGRTAPPA
jgi:methionine-rich copper-binding protein CopC